VMDIEDAARRRGSRRHGSSSALRPRLPIVAIRRARLRKSGCCSRSGRRGAADYGPQVADRRRSRRDASGSRVGPAATSERSLDAPTRTYCPSLLETVLRRRGHILKGRIAVHSSRHRSRDTAGRGRQSTPGHSGGYLRRTPVRPGRRPPCIRRRARGSSSNPRGRVRPAPAMPSKRGDLRARRRVADARRRRYRRSARRGTTYVLVGRGVGPRLAQRDREEAARWLEGSRRRRSPGRVALDDTVFLEGDASRPSGRRSVVSQGPLRRDVPAGAERLHRACRASVSANVGGAAARDPARPPRTGATQLNLMVVQLRPRRDSSRSTTTHSRRASTSWTARSRPSSTARTHALRAGDYCWRRRPAACTPLAQRVRRTCPAGSRRRFPAAAVQVSGALRRGTGGAYFGGNQFPPKSPLRLRADLASRLWVLFGQASQAFATKPLSNQERCVDGLPASSRVDVGFAPGPPRWFGLRLKGPAAFALVLASGLGVASIDQRLNRAAQTQALKGLQAPGRERVTSQGGT